MGKVSKTVLVDMDGVLADFDGATEAFLRKNHPSVTIAARTNFYFRDDYPDISHQAIINELHGSKGFFQALPPVPHATEGWQRLIDLGYEPRICSSPLAIHEWCKEEKLQWLQIHLGAAAAEAAIIDSKKELYNAIALIDDRPVVKNADVASWQHVLFDQPYNAHIDTKLRLRGWQDPQLGSILAQCALRYATAGNTANNLLQSPR